MSEKLEEWVEETPAHIEEADPWMNQPKCPEPTVEIPINLIRELEKAIGDLDYHIKEICAVQNNLQEIFCLMSKQAKKKEETERK